MSGDRIMLRGIRAFARHGVLPHERELGQSFTVDVVLELDLAAAARSDELADTVDYGAVAAAVHEVVTGTRRDLVEAVAGEVADAVLALDGRLTGVEVSVHKPAAPVTVDLEDVVVTVRREPR